MLSKKEGGLGLDNFVYKMQALLVRPFVSILAGDDMTSCRFMFARYFLARNLRVIYPFMWSNAVPHSDVIPVTYSHIKTAILYMYKSDKNFAIKVKRLTDVTRSLTPQGEVPRVMTAHPSLEWPFIWSNVFDPILCNNLKSFAWKVAHEALYVKAKLFRWGVGDGKCPFCGQLESLQHLFWDCKTVYSVLGWAKKVMDLIIGPNSSLDFRTYLYGDPILGTSNKVWSRLWFIFVSIRKATWKRRCDFYFEKLKIDDIHFISSIKNEFRLRILVDYKRWSRAKFKEI